LVWFGLAWLRGCLCLISLWRFFFWFGLVSYVAVCV
jgi:hypothetical protein